MKLRFLFLFFLFSSLFAQETLLTTDDVKVVMDKFFELHIDKDAMSPEVLERSFKIYVTNFDPSHAYLLQEEAAPYERPNAQFLAAVHTEYENDEYSAYFALNGKIQESIVRARTWRTGWTAKELVQAAKNVKKANGSEKDYSSSYQELKNRHRDRFVQLIAFQMEELGHNSYDGKEEKLVALCEKQVRLMENGYLGVDDDGVSMSAAGQEHQVILRTLKAMAHSLDGHTAYYSPDEAYAMKVQLEKGMCGIGVVMREGIDGITVHEVIKGGPAEKSGKLQSGDIIVGVDGKDVQGLSFQKVLELMRGKEGSRTQLGILRQSGPLHEHFSVALVRRNITLDDKRVDVEAEPYQDGVIGKITLHSFYEGGDGVNSEADIKAAIEELRSQGPLYGLVLDMRENSGGFLSQAVKVSGLFISSGVVVISKYSDGSMKYYRAIDGQRFYDGPLVVLISRGSASATEIVAQALSDYGVAVVAGDEQTYGKGTIQHQTVTGGKKDSFFKVTVGRYYSVSGQSTQIHGVKSDILVPTAFQYEELGEGFTEYPLPADQVAAAYDDDLSDVDPFARKWFQKYYTPTLQPVETRWTSLIPQLKERSTRRIAQNRDYQLFLQQIKAKKGGETPDDLQMEESVNIVKDMLLLSN